MNNLEDFWANTRPNAKSIEEWIKYENFIENQLSSVSGNNNVKGLECGMSGNKITYEKSPFNALLSKSIKNLYREQEKADQENMPLLSFFTSVFSDSKAYFLPYALKLTSRETSFAILINYEPEETQLQDTFAGKYDSEWDKLLTFNKPKTFDVLYKISPSFLSILKIADERPVLGVCFWQASGFFHAIALICFKKEGKYHFCVYDPMYYNRPDKAYENEYNYALMCAYVNFYLLGKMHNVPVQVENLSMLCPSTPRGKHCVQYLINAEYCSMFALYFLYLYAKAGCPTEISEIQPIVNDTFMTSQPGKMTRAVCAETNKFKIKMTSFMLSVIALFVQDMKPYLEYIKKLANNLKAHNGITYLHPDLEGMAGGRRRPQLRTSRQKRKLRVRRRSHKKA